MAIDIQPYDHARDFAALKRIYFEVGWLGDDEEAAAFEEEARHLRGFVFPVDGEAECAVLVAPGAMRHLRDDLGMTAVLSVTTSRIARRLGAAKVLTARALADGAEQGSALASLSMFDQGFYERLGFGTGAYSHYLKFDPATLAVERPPRPPKRLTVDDHWRDLHGAMHARQRGHGGCVLHPPEVLRGNIKRLKRRFCLGYFDAPDGALSHCVWGKASGEHGPYEILGYAYRNDEQLFELLALIRALGDQVSSIVMEEPPEIQLQDLLRLPLRHRECTRGGLHENGQRSFAESQTRMLDVPQCLAGTRLDADDVRFNLHLADPIEPLLDARSGWRGVGGSYAVTLGAASSASPGQDRGLPELRASVGAFTRLWLGVRSASSLALTDDLRAAPELLAALDRALRLPRPHVGWGF